METAKEQNRTIYISSHLIKMRKKYTNYLDRENSFLGDLLCPRTKAKYMKAGKTTSSNMTDPRLPLNFPFICRYCCRDI